jgi:hypothetical protein
VALSNWDTMSMDQDGEPTDGSFTSPLGVEVEIYKNWLYIRDGKAWQDGGSYIEPTVMQVEHGVLTYKDVHIVALRGPQNGVFAACWTPPYMNRNKDDEKDAGKLVGMIGCGVYGFRQREEHERDKSLDEIDDLWVGVKPESAAWWQDRLREEKPETHDWGDGPRTTSFPVLDVPDELRKLDFAGTGKRFNQGDAYFAEHMGGSPADVATAPGEAAPTMMSKIVGAMAASADTKKDE